MAPKKKSFSDEGIVNHFGAIRLRVTGSANLLAKLYSLDEVEQTVLAPIPLINKTATLPNRLSNFTQQRAKLELRTTEINEVFQISKIVIFIKPVAKSFPEMT